MLVIGVRITGQFRSHDFFFQMTIFKISLSIFLLYISIDLLFQYFIFLKVTLSETTLLTSTYFFYLNKWSKHCLLLQNVLEILLIFFTVYLPKYLRDVRCVRFLIFLFRYRESIGSGETATLRITEDW